MESDWLQRERSQGIYLWTYVNAKIVTLKTLAYFLRTKRYKVL